MIDLLADANKPATMIAKVFLHLSQVRLKFLQDFVNQFVRDLDHEDKPTAKRLRNREKTGRPHWTVRRALGHEKRPRPGSHENVYKSHHGTGGVTPNYTFSGRWAKNPKWKRSPFCKAARMETRARNCKTGPENTKWIQLVVGAWRKSIDESEENQ
jgi:hypothetical protein